MVCNVKVPVEQIGYSCKVISFYTVIFVKLKLNVISVSNYGFPVLTQDASPRVPGGSPRTPNRSVSSNVASVSPIPAGSKKIDPNMKGTLLFPGENNTIHFTEERNLPRILYYHSYFHFCAIASNLFLCRYNLIVNQTEKHFIL